MLDRLVSCTPPFFPRSFADPQWLTIRRVIVFACYSTGDSPRKTILTLVLLYITVALVPTILLIQPSANSFGPTPVLGLVISLNMVVAPTCVALQFISQFIELRRQHGEPGMLILLSLGLQVPVMAAIAARWYLRTQTNDGNSSRDIWSVPIVSYAICAVGYAGLLANYYVALGGSMGFGDESDRAPLLS